MIDNSLLNIEQILDDLEDLAKSPIGVGAFLHEALQKCQAVLNASAIAILIPTNGKDWITYCKLGSIDQSAEARLLAAAKAWSEKTNTTTPMAVDTEQAHFYGRWISESSTSKGVLVAGLSDELSPSSVLGLQEILQAFAEVISLRQSHNLDRLLAEGWPILDEAAKQISDSTTYLDASALLVNAIASVVPSARISIHRAGTLQSCEPIAISSHNRIDLRSPTVIEIKKLADIALREKRLVVQSSRHDSVDESDQNKSNYLFLPFHKDRSGRISSVLGVEFSDYEAFANGVGNLTYILPYLANVWHQQTKLLSIPYFARALSSAKGTSGAMLRVLGRSLLITCIVAGLLFLLFRPQELLIEANGALMPTNVKSVFASADGFVSELLVKENQVVDKGQTLLILRSPGLELEQEELEGQLRALEEQAKGLQIELNQFDSTAPDALTKQSLIASKVKDIEIQRASLRKQLSIIEKQIGELELVSPLKGVVVGHSLSQQLQMRPVNRGDLLFKIMDLDDQWELKLQVPDHDSQYVIDHYAESSNNQQPLQFVVDSQPDKPQAAMVTKIANRVDNMHREGCFLEVTASAENLDTSSRRVGSSVHAFFSCGDYPTWFVWTRPLIESARRKLWF